ncbi:MAG: hypothetical protein RIR65_2457 [Planctomycetota bacterium]
MSARHGKHARREPRGGFTLVELLLATGLLALLVMLVFQLFDRTLSLWRTGETRRSTMEQATVVADLLADDLRSLEPGAAGDLVVEWTRHDLDADGVLDAAWPRVRMVRIAGAAEVSRLRQQLSLERAEEQPDASLGPVLEAAGPELVEVQWAVVPASLVDRDARAEGRVLRGARLVSDTTTKSFFASDFFGASARPPAGTAEEVCGGVLWLSIACAGQSSVVNDGWSVGGEAVDATASWDAWNRDRPDADIHPWNAAWPWMPKARGRALLPRRVRVELEIERPVDRLRRTRLVSDLRTEDRQLVVDDARHLPDFEDAHLLLGGEWVRVLARDGASLTVERGVRGTQPATHARGAMVHWGRAHAREVVVGVHREDWNL